MKEIPLTQGKVALVDDEDFEAVAAVKWCAKRGGQTYYAERHIPCPGGSRPTERMHRLVLARVLGRDLLKGEHPDHINGDGLDNQRSNLRVATRAQNMRNCRRRSANPSSQYLGVSFHKDSGKWQAQVRVPGKQIHLGIHSSELAAAQAREAFISVHPELHARSNFPITGDPIMNNPRKKKPLQRGQDSLMLAQGYLSVSAVSVQCGVTRATVDLWARNGKVTTTRVGMRVYVQRKSLEEFLGEQGKKMLEVVT